MNIDWRCLPGGRGRCWHGGSCMERPICWPDSELPRLADIGSPVLQLLVFRLPLRLIIRPVLGAAPIRHVIVIIVAGRWMGMWRVGETSAVHDEGSQRGRRRRDLPTIPVRHLWTHLVSCAKIATAVVRLGVQSTWVSDAAGLLQVWKGTDGKRCKLPAHVPDILFPSQSLPCRP